MATPINEIQSSPTFKILPRFEQIYFKGVKENGLEFLAEREGVAFNIFTSVFIRKDEKLFSESVADVFNHSLELSSSVLQGVYHFTVLDFDFERELASFNVRELSELIVNHGRKMTIGQDRLLRYSSCFGLLKRLSSEDWGKAVLKLNVLTFANPVEQFDGFLKKLLKGLAVVSPSAKEGPAANPILVLHDLSPTPVYSAQNQAQQERLKDSLQKGRDLFAATPEIFLRDKNGVCELGAG